MKTAIAFTLLLTLAGFTAAQDVQERFIEAGKTQKKADETRRNPTGRTPEDAG